MKVNTAIKAIRDVVGGAALLCLLTAATCDGAASVKLGSDLDPQLDRGQCRLNHSIDNPAPAAIGDVLQLANGSDVNDFIQCRVIELAEHVHRLDPDFGVEVADGDAVGHSFVADRNGIGGAPALMVNLSR